VLLTSSVYQCLCSRCDDECSPLEVCEQECEQGQAPPPPTSRLPAALTDTGLYMRPSANGAWQLAPYVRAYAPEYPLFSDYSAKQRYIYVPRCSQIDTSNMDHWSFPVGTRVWKQFTRDGVRIETRLLARYGAGEGDWAMGSYEWPLSASGQPDPALARRAPDGGVLDVNGTGADIPSVDDCRFCHERLSERVLSFSAIQLTHNGNGVTFTDLVDWGKLTRAPRRTGYDPPGNATARAALGYLHANCGGCHNDTGIRVSLYLRLLVDQNTVESSWAYTTAVNAPTGNPNFPMDRIEPGEPEQSAIIQRMLRNPSLGETEQMPPLARELVHTEGVATVSAWIRSLR